MKSDSGWNGPGGAGGQRAKTVFWNAMGAERLCQRIQRGIARFIGKLERAPMVANAVFCAAEEEAEGRLSGFWCWSRMNQRGS